MIFNEEYDDILGFNLDSKGHFQGHFKNNCSLLRKNPYYGLYEWTADLNVEFSDVFTFAVGYRGYHSKNER